MKAKIKKYGKMDFVVISTTEIIISYVIQLLFNPADGYSDPYIKKLTNALQKDGPTDTLSWLFVR